MLNALTRAIRRYFKRASPDAAMAQRWDSPASRQFRRGASQKDEVIRASADLETDALGIGQACEKLRAANSRQDERMSELLSLAGGLAFEGRAVPVGQIGAIFSAALDAINAKIVEVARNAMAMVFALEKTTGNLDKTERCIGQIDIINGKTNMLAINAMVEAVRAGEGGTAFRFIANEIRELSKLTKGLAQTMRHELGAVVAGVRESHAALREVAGVEMAQNIMARERLDRLVATLAQRNERIAAAADAAALENSDLGGELDRITATIAAQDRVQRRLRRIVDALAGAPTQEQGDVREPHHFGYAAESEGDA
jgi:methyl-accepting chemotaxis protein